MVNWINIPTSKSSEHRIFDLTVDFKGELDDLGNLYQHPRVKPLKLHDVYVYPELEEIELSNKRTFINNQRVQQYLYENNNVLILGPENSGKTSLLKMTFLDLLKRGMKPIYIDGSNIKSVKSDNLRKLINSEFTRQYTGDIEVYQNDTVE